MNANRKLKPSALPPRPLPLRVAAGLGLAVLLAHLWLLSGHLMPVAVQPARDAPPLSFATRRIEAAPTPPAAAMTRPAARSQASFASPPAPVSRPSAPNRVDRTETSAEAQAEQVAKATQEAAPTPAEAATQRTDAALPAEPADTSQATTEPAAPPPAEPAQHAATPQVPGSARLRYELNGQSRGFRYSADGELTWQQDGQRYEARMLIQGLLLVRPRVMTSTGELGLEGVVPRRFSDKTRTEQATHFQPERGRILFSSNAPEAPWQPGAQDRVSLFFQLAGLLAAEPARYTAGTQIKLLTAGTREADTWTFTVMGTPTLALPIGEQATLALKREPRREYDQTIEIWFAPALGYLPARIRITQANGDVIDQRLAAIERL